MCTFVTSEAPNYHNGSRGSRAWGWGRQTDGLCSSTKEAPATRPQPPGSSGWQVQPRRSPRLCQPVGAPGSWGQGWAGPALHPAHSSCASLLARALRQSHTGALEGRPCLQVPQRLTPAGLSHTPAAAGRRRGPWQDGQILPQIPASSPALLLGLEFPPWQCFRVNVMNKTGDVINSFTSGHTICFGRTCNCI